MPRGSFRLAFIATTFRCLLPNDGLTLEAPTAPRERPALTTLYCGNHSLCDENHRYTRYADGSEELYDRQADPHEFDTLISQVDERAELRAVIERLSAWIPKEQVGKPDHVLSGHGR